MKRERDTQRARYWKAVKVLKPFASKLADMKEVRRYIEGLDRATLKRRYGEAVDVRAWPFEIKDGRGYGRAVASPSEGWVTFPRSDRDTIEVLKTVAYLVAARTARFSDSRTVHGRYVMIKWGDRRNEMKRRQSNDPLIAWHGWRYCAVLMDLVRFAVGEAAADALKASFDKEGVRWTKPIRRNLTDEQKEEAVEKGQRLGALMKDRRARQRFAAEYPEAPVVSKDEFGETEGVDYETLYRLWRP